MRWSISIVLPIMLTILSRWEGWQVQATGYATANDYGQNYMKYDKIVRCNNFLANIDRPEMSEEIRSRLTAEVRFFKGLALFSESDSLRGCAFGKRSAGCQ